MQFARCLMPIQFTQVGLYNYRSVIYIIIHYYVQSDTTDIRRRIQHELSKGAVQNHKKISCSVSKLNKGPKKNAGHL